MSPRESILIEFSKMRFDRRECRPALRRPESPRPGISDKPSFRSGPDSAQSRSTPQPEAPQHSRSEGILSKHRNLSLSSFNSYQFFVGVLMHFPVRVRVLELELAHSFTCPPRNQNASPTGSQVLCANLALEPLALSRFSRKPTS